jgi:hypothetical protein
MTEKVIWRCADGFPASSQNIADGERGRECENSFIMILLNVINEKLNIFAFGYLVLPT